MSDKLKEIIGFSEDGRVNKLKAAVFELLSQKANERLDLEKMNVAGNMFKDEVKTDA
jgi:hypothetical protein